MDLQRRWKSLRDSFRRELAKVKKAKSGSAAETGRKEYIYFKQLSFLLPICETKSQEEEATQGPVEERNTEDENQLPDPPPPAHQKTKRKTPTSEEQLLFQTMVKNKKRKTPASEEQLLFQTLVKNLERKANEKEPDDPDKHFLLGLLPHFKSLPEDSKLEVKGEIINILKRYKQHATFANRQFLPAPTHFFPGPTSSVIPAPHSVPFLYSAGPSSTEPHPILIPNSQHYYTNTQASVSTGKPVTSQPQPVRVDSPYPESAAASQAISPQSDSSSICDDYFTQ